MLPSMHRSIFSIVKSQEELDAEKEELLSTQSPYYRTIPEVIAHVKNPMIPNFQFSLIYQYPAPNTMFYTNMVTLY